MPLGILTTFLVSHWPALVKLAGRWDNGDNSYGYLIVPLFLYLCWEERARFRFGELSWNSWGPLLIGLSTAMLLAGELGSMETLAYAGIWMAAVGTGVTLYGLRLRLLAFPFLVLLFLVPLPSYLNGLLTFRLKMAASSLAVAGLQWVGLAVLQQGNIIDLGSGRQLQVVDACSGLRYFVPLVLTGLLVGRFFVPRLWSRLLLLALVPPLSVAINGLRIWVTGILMAAGHGELAQDLYHDFTGWIVFLGGGGALLLAAMLLKALGRQGQARPMPDPGGRQLAGLARPLALAAAASALFAGSGWALAHLPSLHQPPERATFDHFPMQLGPWQGKAQPLSPEILDSLWSDDTLSATFTHTATGRQLNLLIPYYRHQGTQHTAHAPQACLLGSGWIMVQEEDREIDLGDRHIPVRTMLLERDGSRLLASYFFAQRGRFLTSPWQNKLALIEDALTRRRTDGALVRIELPLLEGEDVATAQPQLTAFLRLVWPLLPEYVPG
ncbi:MAG: VPLPA-CTERM-specific exosortase XrtD [Thermodesulfobacteriota bacterium]